MTGIKHETALRATQLGASLHGLALDDEALERVAVQWERLATVRELLDACAVDENDEVIVQALAGGAA